jgi:hypothetical protein
MRLLTENERETYHQWAKTPLYWVSYNCHTGATRIIPRIDWEASEADLHYDGCTCFEPYRFVFNKQQAKRRLRTIRKLVVRYHRFGVV